MSTYERVVIIQALRLNNFSRTLTAASLGIKRDRLYKRMRFLKINLREIPGLTGRPRKKT
jgi:DNA-binding NtrC family response regulator